MTQRAHHPLPKHILRLVARLVQVHFDTHPERLARRFGLSQSYVRQIWRDRALSEMGSPDEAFEYFKLHKVPEE